MENSSHSDLEADDEEFDSLNQSDSINQSDQGAHTTQLDTARPRVPTPTGDTQEVIKYLIENLKNN